MKCLTVRIILSKASHFTLYRHILLQPEGYLNLFVIQPNEVRLG